MMIIIITTILVIIVAGKYYLKAVNVKALCHDKCICTLCMEPVRTTMVQFIKYIEISLNNTISNMMVEFFFFYSETN